MTYWYSWRLRSALCILVAALLIVLAPCSLAHADSPFDDPAFQPPQGGGPGSTASANAAPLPALPAGYTEIPPPTSITATPAYGSPLLQGGNPNDPLAWLNLTYNPGKWLIDSVLGAISGIILSITSILQSVAIWAFGPAAAPGRAVLAGRRAGS